MDVNFPLGALVCNWNKVGELNFVEKKLLQSQISLLINQVDFISLDIETLENPIFKTISRFKIKPIYLWTIVRDYQKYLAKHGVEKIIAENFY